ncbi:Yip1 family protein [Bacillus pseudomycoides]|uniref:Yip1 family protein n=1 Tax=Bacillus pseudomycoides TaxID=64104 RepID=UPI000BED84D4|nr:Yip1 family protein [Bacillus pseudomycoides]PEE36764.1 hypothetical protein COO02_25540 [Bacillus pseudomycoides]PEI95154.1 hypothetical protein CN679_04730 [Bacillus pseudomycoides]PGA90012.1 hypothetical protein COL91_16830 [Bacillus pseudomycoides]PHF48934.1 hypothetical protein COF72_08925 [Bacillus pseudomycoides]
MEPNVNSQKVSGEKPSLLGMITSPGLQFERMKATDKVWGMFFLVALLQALVNGLSTYVVQSSPEMMEIQKKFGTGQEDSIGYLVGKSIGSGFIGIIIGTLIVAAVYKIFMMFFGNDTSYKKLLAIIVYANIVLVIGGLINSLLDLIFGSGATGYTSLAPLFEQGTTGYAIGSIVEVFYLWNIVLIWMGLQITAGLGKVKAAVPIIVLFIIKVVFVSVMVIALAKFMQGFNG